MNFKSDCQVVLANSISPYFCVNIRETLNLKHLEAMAKLCTPTPSNPGRSQLDLFFGGGVHLEHCLFLQNP
jgi:hypothetical protein